MVSIRCGLVSNTQIIQDLGFVESQRSRDKRSPPPSRPRQWWTYIDPTSIQPAAVIVILVLLPKCLWSEFGNIRKSRRHRRVFLHTASRRYSRTASRKTAHRQDWLQGSIHVIPRPVMKSYKSAACPKSENAKISLPKFQIMHGTKPKWHAAKEGETSATTVEKNLPGTICPGTLMTLYQG